MSQTQSIKEMSSHSILGMHGHGKTYAAPASDAATCEGRHCSRVGAVSSFFFFFFSTTCADSRWRGSYSSRIALNRADLRRLGLYRAKSPKQPIQAEIQKKRKRKRKRCKTHRLNLITNPKGPKLSHAFSLHSNFSSLSFISLCCVLSASLSLRHSATQSHTQSHSQLTLTLTRHNLTLNSLTTSPTHSQLTLTLTQSHSNFWTSWNVLVSILWAVFNLWTSSFSYYLLLLLNLVYIYIILKSMLSNILKI